MNVAVSLGWIGNAVAFLGLVAGYVALSAFVGMQVIWAVMVAATAWLAMRFVDDLVCTVLASRGAAGRRINTRFGIEPRLVDRAAVLLSVALRAVVALAALIALAMPWGAGGTDLVDRSMQLLRGITIGELVLSPRNIVRALLVFAGASLLLHLFRRWLERRLLPTTRMDEGMRASVATLVGYAGMVLAIAMALAAIGVGLERIAWIASALSVGIGFGLQAIVQNFISGLILLAERPVKVGDWVVVGDAEGDIRRINVRATEIQTGDRTTVLVPNSELITKAVRNRTYANAEGLVKIQLPMPLSTDPDRVRDLLLEVFREHPAILETPAPSVAIDNITNDRIVFSASGYVPSPRQASATRSALLFEILRRLRAQEMPPG
ncbi:Small-conductance mechanosensitive channel [Pseudoxanthomonas taiwanensis J19]|uniref:Small-conductance mechanosensitive channel n=2 Tax=Pseudoxanthomonas TaxID=83618 RepID=A0A562E4R7_9GAMM|nr:Small-conductance mechanosensitive channel [Pseudoxanthomonas taiwanensis J19]